MSLSDTEAIPTRDPIGFSDSGAGRFLAALFEVGTFLEIGAYRRAADGSGALEGVVTGFGSVDGRPVFAFAQDDSDGRAAFTAAQGQKIAALYRAARRAGAPIVGVFSGAGARVSEGVDCLSAYGEVLAEAASAKSRIPQIAVIAGPCGGASAILAEEMDITVLDRTKGETYLTPEVTEADKKKPVSDLFVSGPEEAAEAVKKLLALLPTRAGDGTVCGEPRADADRPLPEGWSDEADPAKRLDAFDDEGAALIFDREGGEPLFCALLRLNGRVIGAVASAPGCGEGRITAKAARRAARFLSFLGRFSIPVLTLVDAAGLTGNDVPAMAALAEAYLSCRRKVTVLVGNAFGSAFLLLGSKALGADYVFALDRAVIGALPPETAVEFLLSDRLKEAEDPDAARIALREEWLRTKASPLAAARSGDIDDIVKEAELRQRVAAAFEILG